MHQDTIASEALSAAIGGAASTAILYPLEVLKTRMQASDDVEDDESKESSEASSVEVVHQDSKDDGPATSNECTNEGSKNMLEYAKIIYMKEGAQIFLRGIEMSALQSAMEKGLYFFAYTILKDIYSVFHPSAKSMGGFSSVILGCLAEWAHLPITMPFDCLTTAIQTEPGFPEDESTELSQESLPSTPLPTKRQQSAFILLMNLWKRGDVYKGIQAYYVLCFKPAIQYAVFERAKAVILRARSLKGNPNPNLSAVESFVLGMIARSIATIAVFPFVRAKVMLQKGLKQTENQVESVSSNAESSSLPPQTVWSLLSKVYETKGLAGLYQGVGPEITRGALSAALMLMIKEKLGDSVKYALYGSTPRGTPPRY